MTGDHPGGNVVQAEAIDWDSLRRLRQGFLDGSAGRADYWANENVVASYDRTFAQRIGWKWDYVLAELKRRGWGPPEGELLDWGCGSGVAGRAFLDHFGTNAVSRLQLWDRSPVAMNYASRAARARFPALVVSQGRVEKPAVLLLSHVLTELAPEQVQQLEALVRRATSVIWVEPGTYEASLTLIAIRERLRDGFQVVAPCTHQARCGILAPENEPHWCHHFAPVPAEVFTDPHWSRFATMAGIDLRSLPLSFLVLDKRPLAESGTRPATRIIGRPRIYKAHALLLGCDATGVREWRLTKRLLPEEFRRLKKGDCPPLQMWDCDGTEILETRPLD